MGFFNGLLKGLGFESNSKEKRVKEVKVDTTTAYENKGAEYDLKSIKIEDNIVYSPKSEVEVQELVDRLKKGENITVDLQNFKNTEYVRALDFMSGAIYVLDGKIKKISEKTYFFCQKLD